MKKFFLCLLVLSMATPLLASTCKTRCTIPKKICSSCDCDITGRSFFAVRPHFHSNSAELVTAFREDRTDAREDGHHGAIQAVLFGSKSRDTEDLIRYFTPFCKTELIVDSRVEEKDKDLLAQHFNIFPQGNEFFRSKISFEPRQTVIGLGLHYRQAFWRNEEKGREWFFSISSPITRVKNEFNLNETTLQSYTVDPTVDENVVANMAEAFKQKEWKYGKIDSKGKGKSFKCPSLTETKLADIELKIGIEWLDRDPYHLESYAGILIPTGNTPKGEYIFEPIVGYGKHWGVMYGSALGFKIWSDEEKNRDLRVEYAVHTQYLFSKCHIRSIDLRNKPFSRYMEVYKDKAQAQAALDMGSTYLATPGINIFTLPVKVTPGYSFNITTAFVLSWGKGFQGEAGYNFYARRAECIKLSCPWKLGPALKAHDAAGQVNPVRNITGNPILESIAIPLDDVTEGARLITRTNSTSGNYDDFLIREEDLDLASAAHPAGLAHTFFGALGYRWDEREYPVFLSGGGSYEFSITNNATIDRWTIWAKCGFSF